ncbi:MAG: alkaline phosphatase family protein [Gemmatimonadaceae bacterium]
MPIIILVADGVRTDTLRAAIGSGALPAMARMLDEGGLHEITSVFPSVTGPAYTPFLMGKHPGSVGMPGLRWYDRSRKDCSGPGHSRSYVGIDMRLVDQDLDAASKTMFELVPNSLAAMSVVTRGLDPSRFFTRGPAFAARTAWTHFRGDVAGWLEIDRDVARRLAARMRELRPDFVFAAFTGVDKVSHARGHGSDDVVRALRIVDDAIGEMRRDLESSGSWEATHLWVVSDHGHTPIDAHEDLVGVLEQLGHRPVAHPWIFRRDPRTAVMVSGNAMAHLYVDLATRTRRWWPSLASEWSGLVASLLSRDSTDLVLLPYGETQCEIRSRAAGTALLEWSGDSYTYRPGSGDPIGIGERTGIGGDESHALTVGGEYPDALVQIARIAHTPRSGDIILSAARDWDLRAGFEPIPHVSSHGALHRDHMLVPLLTSKPLATAPLRTVDLMPIALDALSIPHPPGLEGRSR